MVVDRLLEKGEDVQARSREYGTALNMAALRGDQDIATALVERNAIAYIRGKGYNISNMKRSELENLKRNGRESFAVCERNNNLWNQDIEFLKAFCIPDTPVWGTTFWS
jgi:ankyrin repeat protein